MTTQLFRPVGLAELSLIWDKEMREFPPRLPNQPIFYPVANADYARQIARNWNTRDARSGFSGFATNFQLESSYLSNCEPHRVGSSEHVEYWIPAADLNSFNKAISGRIHVQEGFFGAGFIGHIPETCGLQGKDAIAQFVTPSRRRSMGCSILVARFPSIGSRYFSTGCSGYSMTSPHLELAMQKK